MQTGVKQRNTLDFTLMSVLLLIFQFPVDYPVYFKTDYRKDCQSCKWEFKHPDPTHFLQ